MRMRGSFGDYVADQLHNDNEFAMHSILHDVEEFGDSPEEALRSVVADMGADVFADRVGVPLEEVKQFVGKGLPLAEAKLSKYLSIFGLSINLDGKLIPINTSNNLISSDKTAGWVANKIGLPNDYSKDGLIELNDEMTETGERVNTLPAYNFTGKRAFG